MDKIGLLKLDLTNIKYIHKFYKKVNNSSFYIPEIKNVNEQSIACDYCYKKNITNQNNFNIVYERENHGIQICNKCFKKHLYHVTFFQNTLINCTLAWWQFISLNQYNRFIYSITKNKKIGFGFGKKNPICKVYRILLRNHVTFKMGQIS